MMMMNDGRYYPTHRPLAGVGPIDLDETRENRMSVPEPFTFTRLVLVIGIVVAAGALFSKLT